MKIKYNLVKEYDYEIMPDLVKEFFDNYHKNEKSYLSNFFINSIEGKTKENYKGRKIHCKWTWGKEETTYIIERGDNMLFDWLIDNGLDLKEDDYVIIKHLKK